MAVWISKFLGPLIIVLAIPMVITPTKLLETTKQFLADRPLILVTGMLAMTAGLSIINTHNTWVLDWTLLVTFFGWVLFLGGAVRVIAPHVVEKVGGVVMGSPGIMKIVGTLWAVLGAFLTFKGYA